MINNLPQWIQIFLFSMIPGVESKITLPWAIANFHWPWYQAFPIAIAGNMLLVPFILKFLHLAENFFIQFPRWKKAMEWVFPKIRKRADSRIRKYETYGLLFFVAIPLPLTGAGLGSLIAYLFDLDFSKSLIMIFIGVLISTSLTTMIFVFTDTILFT